MLVEIRKVLEHDSINDSVLRFYGDWVVHTKLDRAFSQRIYEVLQQEDHNRNQIISFDTLRAELKAFLSQYDLPTVLVDNDTCWFPFREKLIDILVNVPIVRKAEQIVGTFEFHRRDGIDVEFRMVNKQGETLGRMFI